MGQLPPLARGVIGANPHALHRDGVRARKVLEAGRSRIAKTLNAHSDEIIFTSGATESDNLALLGTIYRAVEDGTDPRTITLITSDLEHAAVSEVASHIAGINTVTIPSETGVIDPKHIMIPEKCRLALISIMYVNNEIGTVQPIKEIAKRVRYLRKQHPETTIILHTDATQAPVHFSLNVAQLGVDMMTLGATKLYTHKGVGVLYKKRSSKLSPIMYGGGQEMGLRPGTESIELIHAFAHALAYAEKIRETETARIAELQQYFESNLKEAFLDISITAHDQDRTPHITHVAIPNFDSELLVIELDAKGIAVSAKSACKNEEDQESHIVQKLYGKNVGAIRFSFGRMTEEGELDRVINALQQSIDKYKI